MKNQKIQSTRSTNFLVSIYHQDHFSYQGLIHWIDTGEKIHFRSELELMNLIHSALQGSKNDIIELRDWSNNQHVNVAK